MAKGRVAERDVVCRACGTTFRTDRAGKAAFYCKRPECPKTLNPKAAFVTNQQGRLSPEERAARQELRRAERAARAALRRALELSEQLRTLEQQANGGRPPAATSGDLAGVVIERAIFDNEVLQAIAQQLARRGMQPEPGRRPIHRAVVDLANATGIAATREALRCLAVEALAWDRVLPPTDAPRNLAEAA